MVQTRERRPAGEEPRPSVAIDPRMRQRRVAVAREVGQRRLRVLVAGAGALTLVVGGIALLHSPVLGAQHLRVRGAGTGQGPAVLAAGRIGRGEPLIDIAPHASARRIEGLAWVARAEVRRSWPQSVTVTVTARVPVGQIAVPGGVALLDPTGRVLGRLAAERPGLPLLRGLGAPPGVGRWLRGSAGYGSPVGSAATLPTTAVAAAGSAATPAEGVLATAAGLAAAHVGVSVISSAAGGELRAELGGTEVVLGPPTQLAAKLASLRALVAAGALRSGDSVDLEVPSRPAVTPPSPASGTAGPPASGAAAPPASPGGGG